MQKKPKNITRLTEIEWLFDNMVARCSMAECGVYGSITNHRVRRGYAEWRMTKKPHPKWRCGI
jgi:hypothetical protein